MPATLSKSNRDPSSVNAQRAAKRFSIYDQREEAIRENRRRSLMTRRQRFMTMTIRDAFRSLARRFRQFR